MPARAKSSVKKRKKSVGSDAFKMEARRQSLLANRSPYAPEDQAWVDEMLDSEETDGGKRSD